MVNKIFLLHSNRISLLKGKSGYGFLYMCGVCLHFKRMGELFQKIQMSQKGDINRCSEGKAEPV